MPQTDFVSLAVIGAGEHALRAHALPARRLSGVQLGAVYDPSVESLAKFEATLGAPLERAANEEQLLASDAQAVIIASPDRFHAASLARAVAAGKHVFIEKPLATTSAELTTVREALDEADRRGLVVSSCHPRRFDPPFVRLKEEMPALIERFGKPLHFSFDFSYHRPVRAWKYDRGLLLDHANHELDLMHFLFGYAPFEACAAYDSFERYAAGGVRGDGLEFAFSGSRMLEARTFHEWATIRFERGDVLLDAGIGCALIHDHERGTRERLPWPKTDYELRFVETTLDFIEAVRGRRSPYLSTRDLMVNTEFGVRLTEDRRWSWTPDRALTRPAPAAAPEATAGNV